MKKSGSLQNQFASVISIIFHPVLMPTLGLIIIFNSGSYISDYPPELKRITYLVVFISTTVLPLSILPFFLYHKMVMDIQLSTRKERIIPYIIAVLLYAACYYLISNKSLAQLIPDFLLAATISVFIILLVSFFWKISAHMVGIGGITGLIIGLSVRLNLDLMVFLIVALLISGLVGYSRIRLESHTPGQVFAGYLVGLLTVLIIYI
ncbi:MAG: phosphatase PAP2 family protein [Bacteroidales bacterium]|nr:phosphatase PAP2 family protein [Bacteroidales bacterium]